MSKKMETEMETEPRKESEETGESLDKEEEEEMMQDDNKMVATSSSRIPQKNPLLIDLILDVTLSNSNLSLKDLLSCRLVCQDWNRISLPKVKSKCNELILTTSRLNRGIGGGPLWNNYFLPTMKNSLSIPRGKFQLRFEPSNPDFSAFQELIDVCHNDITSLHLNTVRLGFPWEITSGPDHNKQTFQNWLKALKNLNKLTITDFDFGVLSSTSFFEPSYDLRLNNLQEFDFLEVGTGKRPSSQFFDGFFIAAQNLQKMTFGVKDFREEYERNVSPKRDEFYDSSDEEMEHDQYETDHDEIFQFLESEEEGARMGLNVVLNSLLNHGRLDGIKSITFDNLSNVNLTTLVNIGKKGLKLESFEVQGSIGYGRVGLCEFLETQKDTLKTLDISGGGDSPDTLRLRFPTEMKELESLILYSYGPLEIRQRICYSSMFPKIKELYVSSGHRRRDYRQGLWILKALFPEVENLVPCETLKKLRMDFTISDQEIDEDEINQRVSRIFPGMVIRVNVDCENRETTLNILGN